MAEEMELGDPNEDSGWQQTLSELPTSAPTEYDRMAAALIEKLVELEAAFPDPPARRNRQRDSRKFIRSKHGVRAGFILKAVGMLAASENLKAVPQLSWETSAISAQYVRAMLPVVQQLYALYKTMKLKVDLEKAHLAADAQQIYTIAKAMTIGDDGVRLNAEVGIMKGAQRRRRRGKNAKGTGNEER